MLENKVALITGCSRGIGRAIAKAYVENGAIVYANARSEGGLDGLNGVRPVYFDVNDMATAKDCVMRISKEEKRLDVLVNNAGIMRDALIGMIDQKLMTDVFQTNVFSVINLCQYAVKLMSRNKRGSIINMTSIVGMDGSAGQSVYSASKGAIIALTKAMSKELCPNGIRVNAIAPGMIDTDLFKSFSKENLEEYIQQIGMRRLGQPQDIANAALFLGSDLSSYMTGQILGVSGGAII